MSAYFIRRPGLHSTVLQYAPLFYSGCSRFLCWRSWTVDFPPKEHLLTLKYSLRLHDDGRMDSADQHERPRHKRGQSKLQKEQKSEFIRPRLLWVPQEASWSRVRGPIETKINNNFPNLERRHRDFPGERAFPGLVWRSGCPARLEVPSGCRGDWFEGLLISLVWL